MSSHGCEDCGDRLCPGHGGGGCGYGYQCERLYPDDHYDKDGRLLPPEKRPKQRERDDG